MSTLQGFTYNYLDKLFDYDPETGVISRRIKRARYPAGTVVGTIDGKGYLHVNVDGVFVRLHRLAWFLTWGREPDASIDHKNTIRTDNRIDNLRQCDQKGNTGNYVVQGNNASGYRGVSQNSKSMLWHAQIKIDGKQTYLGRSAIPEMAALMYNAAAVDHFGDFARFNLIGQRSVFIPPNCRELFE